MYTKLGIVVLLFLGLGFLTYTYLATPEEVVDYTPLSFVWGFEDDDTLNLDGMPRTNVYLDVIYAKTKDRTLIDTVDGGCSVLEETEAGSASATAQCYWAGLGFLYKVVQGATTYQVQRKEFEESSPEYSPVEQEYETIAEFPL